MSQRPPISDDPGTVLDALPATAGRLPHAMPVVPADDELLYRAPGRWTAPRITILDEGSLESGEVVFVRAERIVIGRTAGDVRIPHDAAMSGTHAEIVRSDIGGRHAWVLRDLESSNGTLARCRSVTLRPGMVLQIGSRIYRFEIDGGMQPAAAQPASARTIVVAAVAGIGSAAPLLVEHSLVPGRAGVRHPFQTAQVKIGRAGCGNDIELDDPCVARLHAMATRDAGGSWQLHAQPSLNGVWVRIGAVTLADNSLFCCGEQRFRFNV